MTLFAHFSDPHLVAPRDFSSRWRQIRELSFKRGLAMANWWWRRRTAHRLEKFTAALQNIISRRADFALITGDLTQIGRELDYEFFYDQMLPLRQAKIPALIIAGNHDFYHDQPREKIAALRRELSGDWRWDGEPVIIGNLALCPLDGACAVPVLQAWGKIEPAQIENLRVAWEKLVPATDETLIRIAAGHFPLRGVENAILPAVSRLRGDDLALDFLTAQKFSAYFCGHIHREFSTILPSGNLAPRAPFTPITQYCAGSITCAGALRFYEF